jgi:hypothetical protein
MGGCGRTPRLLDLAVQLFDLTLQAYLQVIRPTIELFRLDLEEGRVAPGNRLLDDVTARRP